MLTTLAEMRSRLGGPQNGWRSPDAETEPEWELSKDYGIFANPIAFSVRRRRCDCQGRAVGTDAILAVAREQGAAGAEAKKGQGIK